FEAFLISAYCFHIRLDDVEKKREEIENDKNDTWGAFNEDGKMTARITDYRFRFYLDGQAVTTGGIGGVATLPEYRNSGAVREIFNALLNDAYKKGEVISTLFPFKHEFYRKVGYDTVTFMNEYTLTPSALRDYRFDGEVKKWDTGDSVSDFLSIYNAFAPKFNLSMERSEEKMLEHLKVEKPYMDRRFSYVFRQNGKPVSYLIFTDVKNDPAAILQVEECAWTCRDGFNAILGFLARFDADYGTIKLPLPKGIDLLRIIRSPRAYDIEKHTCQHFMVRVINAKKLLSAIRKPADCDITINVTDEIIPENNRTYRVKGGKVTESKAASADLEVNVRALGQMAVGAINFDEALLRTDVTLNANEEALRRLFTEKNTFCWEHF
ncbi:MAG: GNAT family N-acetyltransferase, partial [Lachnospiraceae bacterium]|nr:GNAT family N-acetyltransferase [Lachnospiraceae bacterium]